MAQVLQKTTLDTLELGRSVKEYFGAVGDGVTDDTAALRAAFAAGGQVYIPAGEYKVTSRIDGVSNSTITGAGRLRTKIVFHPPAVLTSSNVILFSADSNVKLKGISINAQQGGSYQFGAAVKVTGCSNVEFEDVEIKNGADQNLLVENTTGFKVTDFYFYQAASENVYVNGSSVVGFYNGMPEDSLSGFGIFVNNTTYFFAEDVRCTVSSKEMIGIRENCRYGIIRACYPKGTGDNGISVSGDYFTISNIISEGNYGSGLGVYGSFNTILNVVGINNNQGNTGHAGAVTLITGFGGEAFGNTISNVIGIDNQEVPTQLAAVSLTTNRYRLWSASGSYAAAEWVYYGSNIYQTAAGGTSGATPPTHTSGDVSDGGVTWTFKKTAKGNLRPSANTISGLYSSGNVYGEVYDQSGSYNTITGSNDNRVSKRQNTPWAANTAVFKYEQRIYTSGNVTRRYVCRTGSSGGTGTLTGTTPPTHTSGNVSDGAVIWGYVASTPMQDQVTNGLTGPVMRGKLQMISAGGTGTYIEIFPADVSPVNSAPAPAGSICILSEGTSNLRGIFFKTSGLSETPAQDPNGWLRVQINNYGTTANRPALGTNDKGSIFWDTTLDAPIIWSGTAWRTIVTM